MQGLPAYEPIPLHAPVQVMPVELPGHNSRFKEAPYTCLKSLANDLAGVLAEILAG